MNENQFKSYSETLNAPQHHHLKNNPKGFYSDMKNTRRENLVWLLMYSGARLPDGYLARIPHGAV